jgi:hypothetical protein
MRQVPWFDSQAGAHIALDDAFSSIVLPHSHPSIAFRLHVVLPEAEQPSS